MENKREASWMYVVTGVFVTIVVLAFARLAYGVVLPYMREGLDISYQEAGFLGTATSLGYLCTVILAGMVAAKWGGKLTILLGVSVVTAGLMGLSLTTAYGLTMLFMVLLGIGTAFTYTPLISLLAAWFPRNKGLVIGFLTSGVGIGMLFVGIIVPYLNQMYPDTGWRITWSLFGIVSFAVVIMILIFIKNPDTNRSPAAGSSASPIQAIYTNRNVNLVGAVYGIVGVTYIIHSIFMMSFMISEGISAQVAGQFIAMNGILSIFFGPIWGQFSDRFGRGFALILAMSLNLLATITPLVYPTAFGFAFNHFILGCTINGLFTLVQTVSTEQVEAKDIPLTFSYVTMFFATGQLIGPAFAGWLIDHWGFPSVFIFSSLCMVVGLYLTIKLRQSSGKKTEEEAGISYPMEFEQVKRKNV